jgi:hypothetical protein
MVTMPDRDFLPVLDGVRIHVGYLLGPEQHKTMWDCLEWLYEKHCAARGDKSRTAERDAMLQSCLPEWHQIAATAQPPPKLPGAGGNGGGELLRIHCCTRWTSAARRTWSTTSIAPW